MFFLPGNETAICTIRETILVFSRNLTSQQLESSIIIDPESIMSTYQLTPILLIYNFASMMNVNAHVSTCILL